MSFKPLLIRSWFLLALCGAVSLTSAAPAGAEQGGENAADNAAIHQIITDQMAAFKRDDAAAAFAFNTEELRRHFHDAENFMNTVRSLYQPVYRPSQVTFGALETTDGMIVQHVLTVGPDGNVHEALYFVKRLGDGTWRIDGCILMRSEERTS